jgi:NCS1 family nucleobase:cation symporter-1
MANAAETLSVERHGIEFVPLSERYGTPRRLFTIWFSINLSLLCLTT